MTHTTHAHAPAESAFAAVVAALAGKLAQAGRAAEDAFSALARGDRTEALGALLPAQQALRDALALHTAAVVLHLEPS